MSVTDFSIDLDAVLEDKKSKKRPSGGKLSAGEFVFGPKKPKLTHSGSQFKQATKRYKEKHRRSLPGRVKGVFSHKEWRECFDMALFASNPLAEELHVEAIAQHVMNQGGFDEEALEEMFIGLFEAISADEDDLDEVLEAIDELDEGIKEFAKRAIKHVGKAAKSAAKEAGKDVIKHGASELERQLKGKKTKKGSVGHTLKHAARGALKQIAKDPSKTKDIAKKGAARAGRKLIAKGVKKGMKMVFGKLVKVEKVEELEEGTSSVPKDLPHGSIVQDTDGVKYKIHARYDNSPRRLGSGAVDAGYVGKALGGHPHLVLAGSTYSIPYVRLAKVVKRGHLKEPAKLRGGYSDFSGVWMNEVAEYDAGDKVKPADLPKFLYHGSPMDFEKLENAGEGIHLTVALGLASAFVIKREDVAKGRSGKIRNAQSIWNRPLKDLSEPIKNHVVSVLPSTGAKNPIVLGETGKSKGFIYKVETSQLLGKNLHINSEEPREIVFTGKSIAVEEKIPVAVSWTTKLDLKLMGGVGRNTFAKTFPKSESLADDFKEAIFDFDPLEEAIKRLPDHYVMEPVRLKKGVINATFYGIHEKDQFAWEGNFKNAVYRGTGHGGWEVVPTKEWKALGKALKRNFSAETAATL